MISVKILRDSASRIYGFEAAGHAGYAEAGHDIVCSAVSALCIAIANGLEKYCTSPVSIESNDGLLRVVSSRSADVQGSIDNSSRLLYDTLVDALEAISREYPDRIRISACRAGE